MQFVIVIDIITFFENGHMYINGVKKFMKER